MRIQLVALGLFLSAFACANQDKEMQSLFKKYYEVMDQHKVELVDEVFSQKFLKDQGGKEAFIKGVKELPKNDHKGVLPAPQVTFKKGVMDEIYFARTKASAANTKAKNPDAHSPEFIVVKEDGKLKIEGTISDGE